MSAPNEGLVYAMGMIKLHNQFHPETTTVSNSFIDQYMPAANGTFVKVYLYLLRHLNHEAELSIELIADKLDETEKDIKRALNYWEKQSLIAVTRDEGQAITDISILDFSEGTASAEEAEIGEAAYSVPDQLEPARLNAAPADPAQSEPDQQEAEPFPMPEAVPDPLKPNYTKSQIAVLLEIDEIKWLMNLLEQYLERLLKPADVQLILYLYEGLGFSSELILYLYEYCISMNKKSSHYIEAVAIAWSKDGIDTVEKAEQASEIYNKNFQIVCKTFGIDRKLGSAEKQYTEKWFNTFKLEAAIVEEALSRTLLTTGKPDFKYADKILTNWHKKNVKSINDIKELDKEHQSSTAQSRPQKPAAPVSSASPNNKFNAFPQRSHSSDYYNSLEKHLLNKN